MKMRFDKWLLAMALCLLGAFPGRLLLGQQLQIGVPNRSEIQHNVGVKTGVKTTKPAPKKDEPVANSKFLVKAPENFVPKVYWHQSNLERHWEKHKAEFPEFKTAKEYGDAALYFFQNPPPGTQQKIERATGDKLYYHPASNTFGVTTSKGIPKTMFRPSAGINYWRRQ